MLSIVILSSDGYSDCWDPLFYTLKKYFSGIEKYEIILSTNTKSYSYPGLNILSLANGMDTPWSKRLKMSLERAKNDNVLVMVEDFILRSPIDTKILDDFLLLMNQSDKVDHIRLLAPLKKIKVATSEFDKLDQMEFDTELRFTYLPGLWKKKTLLKYVKDYESPFMSERFGNIRSKIYKDGFYTVSKKYIEENGQFYDCEQSGVIFKGKWPRWVAAFFDKEGIEIDYTIRGFVTKEYRKETRKKSKLELIKNPVSTLRSVYSIIALILFSKKH
jgi:hypothetical protein